MAPRRNDTVERMASNILAGLVVVRGNEHASNKFFVQKTMKLVRGLLQEIDPRHPLLQGQADDEEWEK